jgi:hypothetical protein
MEVKRSRIPLRSRLAGTTPNEIYIDTDPCSSRPGLTASAARTVSMTKILRIIAVSS